MFLKWLKSKKVEEFESQYNGKIKVSFLNGKPRVEAGGLLQSGSILKQLWQKPINKLQKISVKPQTVLVLGLGGGTLINLLTKKYPVANITAIEIDPVMISISQKYFGIEEGNNLKIICTDAFLYLKNTQENFDLILVDLFSGNKIPDQSFSEDFWQNLVAKSKVAIVNTLFFGNYKNKSQQLVSLAEKATKDIFLMRNLSNLFIYLGVIATKKL